MGATDLLKKLFGENSEALKAEFETIDADGNGKIMFTEFANGAEDFYERHMHPDGYEAKATWEAHTQEEAEALALSSTLVLLREAIQSRRAVHFDAQRHLVEGTVLQLLLRGCCCGRLPLVWRRRSAVLLYPGGFVGETQLAAPGDRRDLGSLRE